MINIEIRKKLVGDVFRKFLKAYNIESCDMAYIDDFKFALEFYIVPDEDQYFYDADIVMPNIYQNVIEQIFDISHFAYTPNIDNFIYDKKTQLVFANFGMGQHQGFMTDIMKFIKKERRGIQSSGDNSFADEYIKRGHGLFMSSVGIEEIKVSKDFVYSPEEWNVFQFFKKFKI